MQAVENKRRLAPSSDKSLSLEKLSDIQEKENEDISPTIVEEEDEDGKIIDI